MDEAGDIHFPYTPREPQRLLMRTVENALKTGRHAVIEAPTGTGKTVAVLHSVLTYSLPRGLRLLYLTRTNSQQTQVILEAEMLGVKAIGLEGRRHLCPLVRKMEALRDGTPEELSKFCGKARKDGICGFERREMDVFNMTPQAVYDEAISRGICPYECLKSAARHAHVVVAPYIFLFHPVVRERFIEWVNAPLSRCIIVVDEAHNLPDYLRSLMSAELSVRTLETAQREAARYGYYTAGDDFPVNIPDLLEIVEDCIYSVAGDEERPIEYEFNALLLERLGMSGGGLLKYMGALEDIGSAVRERRLEEEGLWRSYIGAVASFLRAWFSDFDGVRSVDPRGPRLRMLNLDPSPLSSVLLEGRSSVSVSGTLTPLAEYVEVLGLPPDTETLTAGSPYPAENLLIIYDDTVTTRYAERTEEMLDRIAGKVYEILKNVKRNAMVVFPSHFLLREIRSRLPMEVLSDPGEGCSAALMDVVERFRREGGVLFTVFGGRVAEGMDFPGKQLELLVLVGIPYPAATPLQRAIKNYYDARFGRGWAHAYEYPALRRIRQAIGRLIRSETDRGVAIILDHRAARFAGHIPLVKSEDVVADALNFFNRSNETARPQGGHSVHTD